MMSVHTEAASKLSVAKQQYQALLKQSQNPHTDPVLKSLKMAISKLEKQVKGPE